MKFAKKQFPGSQDRKSCSLWTINNMNGLEISLCDWGATVVSVKFHDSYGKQRNLALGFDDADKYAASKGYFGATCGRYANRIAHGQFRLDGKLYQLSRNWHSHHLHGGLNGLSHQIWKAELYSEGNRCGVSFYHTSPDGAEGYPGRLEVKADYSIDMRGNIYMNFRAESTRSTIVNITNHVYWNLLGSEDENIFNHKLRINSHKYVPVNSELLPTGYLERVNNTVYDFRKMKLIPQIAGGYDNCYVIEGRSGVMRHAATLLAEESGINMEVWTDQPGLQFYSGDKIDEKIFRKNQGLCLEPGTLPNAPNHRNFPSALLKQHEVYHHRSMFKLSLNGQIDQKMDMH